MNEKADLEKYRNLYGAVSRMIAKLGYHGEISARDEAVDAVENALYEIDGGLTPHDLGKA